MTGRVRSLASELWLPAAIVAGWWAASSSSTSIYFPPLRTILSTLKADWWFGTATHDLAPSLEHFALGFLCSVIVGIAVGLYLGTHELAWEIVRPAVELARACPPIVLVPLIIGIFGIQSSGKIVLIVLGAVWPVLLNTLDGIRGVDPQLLDVASSYRLSRRDRALRIVLPAAAPQIMVGVRLASAISLIMVVASELFASSSGIGFYILQSEQTFHVAETWAGTLVLGILGYLLSVAIRVLERRVLGWHSAMRQAAGDAHV
jgi:sulfonate transport system permease protein